MKSKVNGISESVKATSDPSGTSRIEEVNGATPSEKGTFEQGRPSNAEWVETQIEHRDRLFQHREIDGSADCHTGRAHACYIHGLCAVGRLTPPHCFSIEKEVARTPLSPWVLYKVLRIDRNVLAKGGRPLVSHFDYYLQHQLTKFWLSPV